MPSSDARDDILQAVRNGDLSVDDVIALAHNLAREDRERVRFLVDASHISRLGLELVARQETAVAELVKNGYDADATEVRLLFENVGQSGGCLEVFDNGVGMTQDELVDGFMRLSTPSKVERPTSEVFQRQRAGRKGIGRFAAQRIGTKLTVTTQTRTSPCALRVLIDWKRFERNLDLSSISARVQKINRMEVDGTILLIEELREAWTQAQIRRAYRYVSELLQPFPLLISKESTRSDPGFKAVFLQNNGNGPVIIADEQRSIYQHAIAVIEGGVDSEGKGSWSVASERLLLDEQESIGPSRELKKSNDGDLYSELRDIQFKAYYFIQEAGLIPNGDRGSVSEILRNRGGIRLYRNGFRVLPYGEPFNDWLRLDAASRSRRVLSATGNSAFLGFVEIHDPDGEQFEETSSREGLVENESFRELQDYVLRSLIAAIRRVESARGRGRKSRSVSAPKPEVEPAAVVAEISRLLDEVEYNSRDGDAIGAETVDRIREGIAELGSLSISLLEERAMLRVLASLGLTIGEFTHEVRISLGASMLQTRELSGRFAGQEEVQLINELDGQLRILSNYVQYFDQTIVANSHRGLQIEEVRDVLNSFEKIIKPSLDREDVNLVREVRGHGLFVTPMHPSEWSSILLNLFTNSLKAMRRARRKGRLLINVRGEPNSIVIYFSDNGDGIPFPNRERVFEPFFTTSSPPGPMSTSDVDQLTGTGLGLKIVRDVVEARGGEINVIDAPEGFSTCLRIALPRAKESEIPADVR